LPWIGALCLSTFPSIGTTRIVNGRCLRVGVWPNEVMAYVSLHVFDFLLNILNSIIPLIIIDFKFSTQESLILENRVLFHGIVAMRFRVYTDGRLYMYT